MYEHVTNLTKICIEKAKRATKRISERVAISKGWTTGVQLSLLPLLLIGQAAPQSTSTCSAAPPSAIRDLLVLINNLQDLALAIAIPLAGLIYSYCGLLWLSGSPELQRRARRVFANATFGLIIVILSEGIVGIISQPLCGGV
jgi:hypothetical protein